MQIRGWLQIHAKSIGIFIAGIVIGSIATSLLSQQASSPLSGLRMSELSKTNQSYQFIDPLIAVKGVSETPKYASMRREVENYLSRAISDGPLTSASVDFRDIKVPGGFVLNADELYTPASLNKVPLMMAYYKLADTDPSILSERIRFIATSDHTEMQEIRSAVKLKPGTVYTVEELIEHMIRYSDNNASGLLTEYLRTTHRFNAFTSAFSDLGVDPSIVDTYSDTMTVEQYSIFLRSLYNATYLSRDYSEKALSLLSETDFSRGLEAGVPNNVQIAEKFGEVRIVNKSGVQIGKQLSNCGIIYFPEHPYLLCIMTKASGDTTPALETVISTVSHIVYTNMQKLYSPL